MQNKNFLTQVHRGTSAHEIPSTSTTSNTTPVAPVAIQAHQPVPVTPVPSPDSLAGYGLQGVIIALIFAIGRPLAEKIYLMLNSNAQRDKDLQQQAITAQLKQSALLEELIKGNQQFTTQMLTGNQNEVTKHIFSLASAVDHLNEILVEGSARQAKNHDNLLNELKQIEQVKLQLFQSMDAQVKLQHKFLEKFKNLENLQVKLVANDDPVQVEITNLECPSCDHPGHYDDPPPHSGKLGGLPHDTTRRKLTP